MDADNGASGHDVTFYTSDDGLPLGDPLKTWAQLGATVTTSGTTSLFSSVADLTIGLVHTGISFAPAEGLRGQVHAFELRGGIGAATLVADPDFTAAVTGC